MSPLFSQAKDAAKDAKTSATPAPAKDAKTAEDKPLPMETGTVVVDPQLVSSDYKNSILKHLKKLKSSFLNYGMKEQFDGLMKSYVDASITYQEKKYINARRKFEQNNTQLNEQAKALTAKYEELYTKLYKDTSQVIIELKVNAEGEENLSPVLEKLLVNANEYYGNAQTQVAKESFPEAVYAYKNSIHNLIKVYYVVNKSTNKNLKLSEKMSKNLLIDEDYVPKDYLKDYDDSIYHVYEVREKEREKEREVVKKGISSKFGDLKVDPAKEPAKDAKNAPDKKPESKESKTPAEPAK